ncbi:MAG: hypothetical protein CMM96_05890 [Rickettsiales bacterium]|nr:hypothetical protein [Rickettsiales bacterium]
MITIFSTAKDFIGDDKIRQENALNSWRSISNEIEIIIFDKSQGTEKASKKINAVYVPDIELSAYGTPILSDLFNRANQIARFSTLCYINADIILPDNFLSVIQIAQESLRKFLMVGYRWDIENNNVINFFNSEEKKRFWDNAIKYSKKQSCSFIDYFIFKKNQLGKIPNFTMGFPGYDNWMIWNARRKLMPVIDASKLIQVIHQNHDVPMYEKKGHPKLIKRNDNVNKPLHKDNVLNLLDCTHFIKNGRVEKNNEKEAKIRYWYKLEKIFPELSIPIKLYRRTIINNFYLNK